MILSQNISGYFIINAFWLESVKSLTMDRCTSGSLLHSADVFFYLPGSKDLLWTTELLTISWI